MLPKIVQLSFPSIGATPVWVHYSSIHIFQCKDACGERRTHNLPSLGIKVAPGDWLVYFSSHSSFIYTTVFFGHLVFDECYFEFRVDETASFR